MRHWMAVVLMVPITLAVLPADSAWAVADPDEARLNAAQQRIDRQGKPPNAQALATEFGVSTTTVERLRAQKQGWGETTIELGMAQQLTRTNPTAYPTMDAALAKIESMRAEKHGWGRIARDLGFKLGPVVSSVQRARHEGSPPARAGTRTETKTIHTETKTRPERSMRSERPEGRFERPERPGRP